jgi:hypothetical protein
MMRTRNLLSAMAMAGVLVQAASAQDAQSLAVSASFQGYSFPAALNATSATLMMLPVSYTLPVNHSLTLDLYTAYARGDVKTAGVTHTLQGLVDTRIRANLAVTPWAALTGSVNLPTGKATHDIDEAIVANSLSTELLGFREALWGTGFGATAGVATAWRTGGTGVGVGASYRVAGQFEPSSAADLKYAPGNEARVRVALDRDIGSSKLTLGATFQNYTNDQLGGHNLFAPGNRWRGDATYSFRAGTASTWTLYGTDIWRENGDVTLPRGGSLNDTSFVAGQQNLAIVGIAGGTRIGSGLNLRPSADFRLLNRKSGANEGWLAGVGTDIPMHHGRADWIPAVRFSYGSMEDDVDVKHGFWGGEASLTLRFGGAR